MTQMQQAPDIKSYSLAEFFVSTYQVPKYQRNYTWGELQVTELVDDLLNFHRSDDNFYLLGDVIAAASGDDDYKFELIDGQQRATTLVLVFSVAYRKLHGWGFTQDDTNKLFNAIKESAHKLKVKMSGNASSVVLDYLANGDIENLTKNTPSQSNVVAAYEVIEKIIGEEFTEENSDELLKFTQRVLQSVYVGRLTLQSVDQATEFFERVNNRGVGLTAADLLKNRLLQKIVLDADYEAAAESWANAEKYLMPRGKQGSMEFLIRQIRQADLGEKVQEKKLFEKTLSEVADEAKCVNFMERIESKFQPLGNILSGKTPLGISDTFAEGTKFFGFTQNHCVKLAGSHLSHDSFNWLSQRLEGRAILSLLASERSQAYEKEVPIWAKNVQALPSDASKAEIAQAIPFDPAYLNQLHEIAYQFFSALRYSGTPGQVKRIRYILARVNHFMNIQGPTENLSLKDFLVTSRTTKKKSYPGFDIEHVQAQAASDFGDDGHTIGNLTLLHTFDNQAEGANPPPLKVVSYGHSRCYATRALTKDFAQPQQVEAVIAPYRVAVVDGTEPWSSAHIAKRAAMYWDILSEAIGADLDHRFPGSKP